MKYPQEVIKVMQPQINNIRYAIKAHFKKRHQYGSQPTKNWIAEYRRVVKNSGYDIAIRLVSQAAEVEDASLHDTPRTVAPLCEMARP